MQCLILAAALTLGIVSGKDIKMQKGYNPDVDLTTVS
jgi:hypothetical protein